MAEGVIRGSEMSSLMRGLEMIGKEHSKEGGQAGPMKSDVKGETQGLSAPVVSTSLSGWTSLEDMGEKDPAGKVFNTEDLKFDVAKVAS